MMVFKMLGIQRTLQQRPDVRPRQVFITRSKNLATKVEKYFTKLRSSLEVAAYPPVDLRMMEEVIEQDSGLIDRDDNEQRRADLPEKFSQLSNEHFPLFITYDQVRMSIFSEYPVSSFRQQLCTMLQNDIRRDNNNDGFIIPKTHLEDVTSPISPTSSWKSRLRAESRSTSSFDHTQQIRRKFVSYDEFLTSYWNHLPRALTRALGEE